MSSEHFERAIKRIDGGEIVHETEILTTSAGQKFKLVIHQLVWYGVKLFLEVDPRLATDDLFVRFDGLSHIEQINVSEHTALVGAEGKLEELKKDITTTQPPNFLKHLKDERVIYHRFYLKVRQGKKVQANPDGYFVPGDYVQVERSGARHSAIYVGNRRLIQVMQDQSEGAQPEDGVVEEIPWEVFHNGETKFFICDSIFRLRANEEILELAKSKIGSKGKLSLMSKTFANSCQFPEEKIVPPKPTDTFSFRL